MTDADHRYFAPGIAVHGPAVLLNGLVVARRAPEAGDDDWHAFLLELDAIQLEAAQHVQDGASAGQPERAD